MRNDVEAEHRHGGETAPALRNIYSESRFRTRCVEEWRRAERSGQPRILALFESQDLGRNAEWLITQVTSTFRETDVIGWFAAGRCLGVLLVELGKSDLKKSLEAITEKIQTEVLNGTAGIRDRITARLQVLPPMPDPSDGDGHGSEVVEALWERLHPSGREVEALKRVLDVLGATVLLIACAPLLLIIGILIRISSGGPAVFRQVRVGFRGRLFVLYKLRTMIAGGDDRTHREYVSRFIAGHGEQHTDEYGQAVYKLTNDERVTRVGRFLRRTSLDELPQLWNVLRGDMSLVGPRPPLPYEVAEYELWHRRRVHDLKPGITGLWQVHGRSRSTFDEMTRMDLKHARPNALGLYLRVLLETPKAVIRGHGAH